MHIDPNDKITAPAYTDNTLRTDKTKDRAFGEIIDEATGILDKAESHPKPQAINNVFVAELGPFRYREKMSIVEDAQRLLDTFSEYQRKLADATYSLKDLSPLVHEMEMGNTSLISAVNRLPDGDGLKDILNQVLIASSVEVVKFNRGDYVNP
jgi:hypothetical protein